MKRVMVIYGTRPEAIKMAPIVLALRESQDVQTVVTVTAQHRTMLDQVNAVFGIVPDHDLGVITDRQSLTDVTVRALNRLSPLIADVQPDAVVVQGDTTTTFVGALAAFYARVPVVHVEAGLRTGDRYAPYPEEINRRLTTQLTELHLAPTDSSKQNLLREGVPAASIAVTGNTVIDALHFASARRAPYGDERLEQIDAGSRDVLLITAHRRESWGPPMREIADAIATLARAYPDYELVLPAHRNPVVRDVLLPVLKPFANVTVTEPLEYGAFARLMTRSKFILTDSGGIQEEAPSLGKPVLVMRDKTERPEALAAGTARLVGARREDIVRAAATLINDDSVYERMAHASNPYGDGRAASRSVAAILALLSLGSRLPDFASAHSAC